MTYASSIDPLPRPRLAAQGLRDRDATAARPRQELVAAIRPRGRAATAGASAFTIAHDAATAGLGLVYWWENDNEIPSACSRRRSTTPGELEPADGTRDGVRVGARGDRLRAPRVARRRAARRRHGALPVARARRGRARHPGARGVLARGPPTSATSTSPSSDEAYSAAAPVIPAAAGALVICVSEPSEPTR